MTENRPPGAHEATRRFRLGDLLVDLELGDVRRGDELISLSGQPLAILSALLRSPSFCLDRDELKRRLWPEDPFGDLDQRLNAAVRLLRRSLGDSTETPRYLETRRGRGYRLCGPVEALAPAVGGPKDRRYRLAVPVLGGLALLLVAFIVSSRNQRSKVPDPRPAALRLALAPIDVIGDDAELEVLAAVLHQRLTTRLVGVAPGRLELVGRATSERLLSERSLASSVEWLLEGRLAGDGGSPRLFLHLHALADDRLAWSGEFEATQVTSSWFPEVLRGLVEATGLAADRLTSARPGTSIAAAYGHYVAAVGSFSKHDLDSARQRLLEALELDPGFVDASVLLGQVLWAKRDVAGAEARFEEALVRDPAHADAHLGLAKVRFFGLWDWAGAETSFRLALDAGAGRGEVHHAWAWFLLASGRFEAAKAAMDRALELDPLNAVLHSDLGWFHYRVRDYPGALTSCHGALEIAPELRSALDCRHRALARLGRYDEALAQGLRLSQPPESKSREWLALSPGDGYARYLLYLEEKEASASGSRLVRAMDLAAAGQPERALEMLEAGLAEREAWLVLIDVTPEFDVLRADPRFEEIRRRVMSGR